MSTLLNMEEPAFQTMADFEKSVAQTLDIEAAMQFYAPKIFRFVLASLRDRDDAEERPRLRKYPTPRQQS